MMDILIKGMEKPISCDDCIVPLSKCDFLQRRTDECPIIEIPTPHGRLIDADALISNIKEIAEMHDNVLTDFEALALVRNAPTILEEER